MGDLLAALASWTGHQVGVLGYLVAVLANTLLNALGLPRLGAAPPPPRWPRVAVLVPARNEEATIVPCLRSLLAQDYPDFAVWVLDDESSDRTPALLAAEAARCPRLTVLRGAPPPAGWLGKPWACQQLARAAEGEVLVFVDADTCHDPRLLRAAVALLLADGAGLLSVLPRQRMGSLAERLLVPLIPWSLLTHYPLVLARRCGWRVGAAAVGQVLLVRRAAYEALGGHAAVRGEVAEDLALARRAAAHGVRWLLADGAGYSTCRMYRSARAAWAGFGRNLARAFGRRLALYAAAWLWLAVAFLEPPLLGALALLGWPVGTPALAAAGTLVAVATWVVVVARWRLPAALVPLYPLVMAVWLAVAAESLRRTATGRATWKGRRLAA
jgi:chlorobactene glucosyltransferase